MSLELLNTRLQYQGGKKQQPRMVRDKLKTLKKALLYSYQAETAILQDGREFRCLINPDKNKPAYDNKIISIPYKDVCLNKSSSSGQVEIGMKSGDVFTWKETNTHWLVYLEYIQENAYFRSEIRRCDQEIKIGDKSYWVYIRGPVETAIEWSQKAGIEWNTLNYSLVMYITADETTNDYFERFKTVKVIDPRKGIEKTWQVVGVDPYYGDGTLQVFLDEYFENPIADAVAAAQLENYSSPIVDQIVAHIEGPAKVSQYSKAYYEIKNATNGKWFLEWNNEEQDLHSSAKIIPLNINIGELGIFTLIYRTEEEDIKLEVEIIPLIGR